MKTFRDPDQAKLFDPFQGVIGRVGWKHIELGWQGLLRHILLKKLPAARLGDDLSDRMGRPSTELYAMCGLLLIREFNNWTVPQTHEAILFRSDVQYALNLEPGFEISQRTIERYIARLYDDASFAADLFNTITDDLVSELELSVRQQRLDSTHVLSDMAVFGRARMMGVALRRFLHALAKTQPQAWTQISETLRKQYVKTSDSAVFGDAHTREQRQLASAQAVQDLHEVIGLFADHAEISQWEQYQNLVTIFAQQAIVKDDRVELIAKTGGDVVQNTSDLEATYCGNKGAGYQVQLSETCAPSNEVNLIVSARVETAVQNDADAVAPMLEDVSERGCAPETLATDAGYGGDKNFQLAKENGIELVAPVPGGAKFDAERIGLDQFELVETAEGFEVVVACPAGHAPLESRYAAETDHMAVTWDAKTCQGCPLLDRCPVKLKERKRGGPSAKLYFEMRDYRAATRRRHEQTEEFRDAYRARSGIEGTNGSLKRRLGLKRLRVRGMRAVESVLLLKLTGWNVLRAATTEKIQKVVSSLMGKWRFGVGLVVLFCVRRWFARVGSRLKGQVTEVKRISAALAC